MNGWKLQNLSLRWEEKHTFLLKMSASQSLLPLRFDVTLLSACQTKQGTLFTEWEVRDVSRSSVITITFTHRFRDDSVHLRMPVLETKLSMLLVPETGLRSGLLNWRSLSPISHTLVLGIGIICLLQLKRKAGCVWWFCQWSHYKLA